MIKYLFDDIKRIRELFSDVNRYFLINKQEPLTISSDGYESHLARQQKGLNIEQQKLHNYLITLDIEILKLVRYFIEIGINELNLNNSFTKHSNISIYQTVGLGNINTLKNGNPDILEKERKLDISEIEKYSVSPNNYLEKGIESFGNNLVDIILNW